jgi:PBP4 family serine-type D-alanyl-D-alanine carboxypeptidase
LYDARGARPMTPASTLKLVVAVTALRTFGPQHRFPTGFVALEPPDADGVVAGPLWFVGGGDPLFTSTDLRSGIGTLARAGVRRVDGPLLVDDSAFRGPERNPRWEPEDFDEGYAAATSAVSLDEDTVEFHVTPGEPGGPARVTIEPPNRDVEIRGSIATGGDTDLHIDRVDAPAVAGKPFRNVFQVDGTVAPGETQKYWKPVVGMPSYVAGAIEALAHERGIAFAAARSDRDRDARALEQPQRRTVTAQRRRASGRRRHRRVRHRRRKRRARPARHLAGTGPCVRRQRLGAGR